MKSILITGAFGQLGSALSRIMQEDYNLTLTGRNIPIEQRGISFDIRNSIAFSEIIDAVQPDIVIHLASMTNVDGCEIDPDKATEVNISSVENICRQFSGHVIYLSTDYVFNGKNGPYSENDKTDPINIYGYTKLCGERLLLENNSNNLVIRSNVVYDHYINTQASFLNWILHSLNNNKNIKVVNDQINNPIWAESLAKIIVKCIEQQIYGTVHWGGADYINRYDFAIKIADMFELDSRLIQPIETEKLNQVAKRPLNSGLKTDYIQSLLGITPPKVEESLAIIKKRIK